MRAVGTVQCIMGHDDSHVIEFCHVGDHSRAKPILRTFLFKNSRCFSLFSAMEEADVVRIVESSNEICTGSVF